MTYSENVSRVAQSALRSLEHQRAAVDGLIFGGPIARPKRVIAPTPANSKFQAEQALGDWAEACLAKGLNEALGSHKAVHYGFSSKTIAGQPGFKEEYQASVFDTCEWGKRADLLILPIDCECASDISDVPTKDTQEIVGKSIGCVEVRSSRAEALKYIAYQKQRAEAGERVSNRVPNFTVKIEDLVKVHRWIEVFNKPQIYAQVFLDVIYGINVIKIMEYIASGVKLNIHEPQKTKKMTIFVPITEGRYVGTVDQYPEFKLEDRLTDNGRHDIFARPFGGHISVDGDVFKELLIGG
ncbi:MAG: AccI family restriction endonuclease [Caulobacteraceae bacterium]|nr:AccI family restriction endonuclease [Caulobacteraceae bacterium]